MKMELNYIFLIDIRFSVNNIDSIRHILNENPYGRTPLNKVTTEIFNNYRNNTKPVLLVIATDGKPTNNNGYPDTRTFQETISNKNHDKFYISFLACSDQDEDVGYLNILDKKVPNVDTLDGYLSESKEVKSVQGIKYTYTFGDHISRLLLGPICPQLDSLHEIKINNKCTIL